ncbi:hypothetical protein TI39_contig5825g00003 [Zymoseptoria brevis]|uniref:Uncharacterized protein n=1 Tax=Zymoseptoria brevis TaxID=1047168 RepID=A0A0F4G6W4_9PEZI|nr:hypothetical protein TI39_contig5825g00003 [Zymoseptoria brevis]
MASSFPALSAAALKTCIETNLPLYSSIVPAKLTKLDDTRYNLQPSTKDDTSTSAPALSKKDLITLVEWKLSHGTFRPALKNLVASNPDNITTDTIREAYALIPDGTIAESDVKASLTVLTKLRGIGPATASLVLSVLRRDEIPFFSDELFRWSMWEQGKGKGWDRPIKYSVKEYLELFRLVAEAREKADGEVKAVELEKVAYVLSTSGGGKAGNKRAAMDEGSDEAKPEVHEKKKVKVVTKPERRSTRSLTKTEAED